MVFLSLPENHPILNGLVQRGPISIACRRKRNGRKRPGAGWRATVFRGVTVFQKARPTTTERPPVTAMIWGRMAIMRSGVSEERVRRQVRWVRLRRMATGYTTWRGMCLNGVGTGMARRMVSRPQTTQRERGQDRATVCCAAAVLPTTPTSRGAPIAATPTRPMPSMGSVV